MRGRDRVYSYSNGRVTAGPDAGRRFASGSFVYTLAGDTWTEFDPSGQVFAWKRVRTGDPK